MKRYSNTFISILGALLLWAAWPVSPFTFLIFIAWVPLLWVEDHISSWKKMWAVTYLHMFLWNILVTWWVWNASLPGALGAFFANSLLMCVPWLLFYYTKRKFGRWIGYASLIVFWITFEYIHHNWELSWPWLTLGNAFATQPQWVQWYQYTGTSGGSLWVLSANIIAHQIFTAFRAGGRSKQYYINLATWIALIVMPVALSYIIAGREKNIAVAAFKTATKNIVVVQPNIDPYEEKFNTDPAIQIQKLIKLSEEKIDSNTAMVVWPETAIPVQAWENELKQNPYYQPVFAFLKRHPAMSLLTGIDSYKSYGPLRENASATARRSPAGKIYYDAFNTAAFINPDTSIELYHKAKLVPGVESLPSFLNFIGDWFEDFGGISGSLGRDTVRKVFVAKDHYYKAAPIICYESIYGAFITEYLRNGANLLVIITNDGWWDDTPGYKQHMNYARLRAIETRKWIARSANTGISCFIDPMGNVIDPQPWNKATAIRMPIPVSTEETFYVQHGDMLSKAMCVIAALLIAAIIVSWVKRKFF
ncbi:MAG: apolipoprotein N-acyltransferase [Agriterribacter sp.]